MGRALFVVLLVPANVNDRQQVLSDACILLPAPVTRLSVPMVLALASTVVKLLMEPRCGDGRGVGRCTEQSSNPGVHCMAPEATLPSTACDVSLMMSLDVALRPLTVTSLCKCRSSLDMSAIWSQGHSLALPPLVQTVATCLSTPGNPSSTSVRSVP